MKQEKIKYSEVIALGFTEDMQSDEVYFNEYGFDYCIITKELTKTIHLDWAKETQLCKMVRVDSPKTGNVKAELPIRNLEHLKEIINFFSDEEKQVINYQ